MKTPKLKKYDIVCFEWCGEMAIGYIHTKELITIQESDWIRFEITMRQAKHITKIGVMPKEWR